MRFIQLTDRGPHGMAGRVAMQHMFEATMRAGNVEGALHISYPRPDGIYWVAFQNHSHATAFLDIIGGLNVGFKALQAKPEGAWFGRINPQIGMIEYSIYRSSV